MRVALHQAYSNMAGNEARAASDENVPGHKLAGGLLGHHGWSPRRAVLHTLTLDLQTAGPPDSSTSPGSVTVVMSAGAKGQKWNSCHRGMQVGRNLIHRVMSGFLNP